MSKLWVLSLFLLACDSGVRRYNATDGSKFVTVTNGGGILECTKIVVDGTPCIVCVGSNKGAISCDWSGER